VRLTDLEPVLVQHQVRDGRRWNIPVHGVAEAHGVLFLCPTCWTKNGGPVGTHGVLVTFNGRGVPNELGSQSRNGGPSRWSAAGETVHNLTLQPSIDCECWHGYVTAGEVTNA